MLHHTRTRAAAALLAACALATGCAGSGGGATIAAGATGGGSIGPIAPVEPGPRTSPFFDDFSQVAGDDAWQNPSGLGFIDSLAGAPAPGLHLVQDPALGSAALSTDAFSTVGGFSISVLVGAPTFTGHESGEATVVLSPGPTTLAMAAIDLDGGGTSGVELVVNGGSPARTSVLRATFPADALYHLFEFAIDEGGIGTWSRDGAALLSAPCTATDSVVVAFTVEPGLATPEAPLVDFVFDEVAIVPGPAR